MEQTSSQRIAWIDAAKGILILSIILGHFGSSGINRVVFIYHVGGFFLLSGYTMKIRKADRAYICQRFTRLMRPYFYTCLMILLADACMKAATERTLSAVTASIVYDLKRSFWASGDNHLFSQVDIGGRIGAIWFLPAMFFAVILAQMILNFTSDWKKRFALGGVLYLTAIVSARYIWFPFSLQSAWMAVVFILLGKYFREIDLFHKLRPASACVGAVFLVVMTVMTKSGMNFVIGYADDFVLAPICMVIASILVFLLSMLLSRWKLLCWIGRNSLKIMCLHLFALECVEAPAIAALARMGRGFGIGSYICLMLAFTLLITWIEEKICGLVRNLHSKGRARWLRPAAEPSETDVLSMMICILCLLILLPRLGASPDYDAMASAAMPVTALLLGGYLAGRRCRMEGGKKPFDPSAEDLQEHTSDPGRQEGSIKAEQGNGYSWRLMLEWTGTRLLLPYAVFCAAALIVGRPGMIGEGGIYILLVLAADLILMLLLYRLQELSEWMRWLLILGISLLGAMAGERMFAQTGWMKAFPVDLILYGIVYVPAGYEIGRRNLFQKKLDYPWYFILATVWASMLFLGGANLTGRQLEPYGTVVLGTVSGFGLLWLLSRALMQYLPFHLEKVIRALASCSVWIYIIYHFVRLL